jgi:hypothetical protein
MAGARRNGPGTALAIPAQRHAMGMWGLWLVAENVVEPRSYALEHMFGSLRRPADGVQDLLQEAPRPRPYAADPSEDQISSLVRTRSTTAEVKSVVPAEPPRSGVLTPAPTVSSAAS